MPIYRGPDGKIIEVRTRKESGSGSAGDDKKTKNVSSSRNRQQHDDEDSTVKLKGSKKDRKDESLAKEAPQTAVDHDKTQLLGFSSKKKGAPETEAEENRKVHDSPVVGWLTVIGGPGKGVSQELGYGTNSIGRNKNEKISLSFGDNTISGSNHAVLTYDQKGRKFYLQHGSGKNLTYQDDEPVLVLKELTDGASFQIGNTTLKFRALCGEDFEWQDLEDSEGE